MAAASVESGLDRPGVTGRVTSGLVSAVISGSDFKSSLIGPAGLRTTDLWAAGFRTAIVGAPGVEPTLIGAARPARPGGPAAVAGSYLDRPRQPPMGTQPDRLFRRPVASASGQRAGHPAVLDRARSPGRGGSCSRGWSGWPRTPGRGRGAPARLSEPHRRSEPVQQRASSWGAFVAVHHWAVHSWAVPRPHRSGPLLGEPVRPAGEHTPFRNDADPHRRGIRQAACRPSGGTGGADGGTRRDP